MSTDKVYIETRGTNATIDNRHGVVTGFIHSNVDSRIRGAFFATDEGEMMHLTLGAPVGERNAWREVDSARVITRDEFDDLSGLTIIRHELGWR